MKHFIGIVGLLLISLSSMQAQMAQIQFIHNAPDVSISNVDVYVNNVLVVDDLSFKSGTAFLDIPVTDDGTNEIVFTSDTDVTIVYLEMLQELNEDETYYAVLDGVYDTAQYTGIDELGLYIYAGARTEASLADDTNLDIITHNGALGFDNELEVDGTQILASPLPLARTIALGDYSDLNNDGYTLWRSDTSMSIEIVDFNLAMGDEGTDFYYTKNIDFGVEGFPDYADQAVIMLLTGFENPDTFENGEPFDAYLLSPDGGDFQSLLSISQNTRNRLTAYPNPVKDILYVESQIPFSEYMIYDLRGVLLKQDSFQERTKISVDMDGFESGVYFITVQSQKNNTAVIKRMIKK